MGEKVLSYHDILLRQEDLELLRGPQWLNDQVIAFYFEYLLREKHQDGPAFVSGATSFFMANGGAADVKQTVASMRLAERPLVFFAVNNNPFVDVAEGGSHWSLLTFWRGRFFHCDSAAGLNRSVAQQLAAQVGPHLASGSASKVVDAKTVQQVNGYDCGVHVMANARALAGALCTTPP
eukprot:CAMPEP_0118924856 /NCGR_PEP_ID=MMETSP1169-20130426/2796_1 /TAXON_ID=36882 /ORGANISM="Pyramimonas obovata, Strain CCMP722" /LENGTH=178 /DNA_ID=CAMNT_0006865995 /DNA_START=844 /DNA_END=1377 /DNA_ORIENTATION=-